MKIWEDAFVKLELVNRLIDLLNRFCCSYLSEYYEQQ